MAIIDKKVSEIYSGRDISSLSDTPSKDGMSASELKARFDQLNKEVIPNYNDLIDEQDAINASKMGVNGSGSAISDLGFLTNGTATPAFGHVAYNASERTFQFGLDGGVTGDLFGETFYPNGCKNVDSVQINDGDFVMYFGAEGNSGVVTIKKASTTLPLAGQGLGIATQNIAVNAVGKVTWFGYVRGIQTDGVNYGESWVDGQILYNSGTVAGGLSKTKPVAPKNAISVGVVVRAHASNGILLVRPIFFPQLVQLSDVFSNAIANGDGFLWNSVNARFENIPLYTKSQVDALLANKVDKVTGKSLVSDTVITDLTDGGDSTAHFHSTDRARSNHTGTQSADTLTDGTTNKAFLATERTKLAGIEAGAEVNNISDANATALTDGSSITLHNHDGRYYSKTEIDGKISSMYRYKGSVANYASLPSSGMVVGDTYNLLDTGHNWAWTGTAWDDLGGVSVGAMYLTELLDVPDSYTGQVGKVLRINSSENGVEFIDPLASPAFTGNPTAPTPALNDNDTSIATTQFVKSQIANDAVEKTSNTGSAKMPSGTTEERPISPSAGFMRFNTTLGAVETYNGSTWITASGQMLGNATVKAISYNAQSIGENITIPATVNAQSTGPITINDGYTVTISDGAVWVII